MARAANQPAAPAVKTERKSADMVTVACKFPPGLVLQLRKKVKYQAGTPMGQVEKEKFVYEGRRYYVRGNAEPNGQTPKGYKRADIEGGFALTRGIPKDFWEEWVRQHKDFPMYANGLIFACPTYDEAAGEAEDHAELKSGFEPLEKDGDPRAPKSLNPSVGSIEQANTTDI